MTFSQISAPNVWHAHPMFEQFHTMVAKKVRTLEKIHVFLGQMLFSAFMCGARKLEF